MKIAKISVEIETEDGSKKASRLDFADIPEDYTRDMLLGWLNECSLAVCNLLDKIEASQNEKV